MSFFLTRLFPYLLNSVTLQVSGNPAQQVDKLCNRQTVAATQQHNVESIRTAAIADKMGSSTCN